MNVAKDMELLELSCIAGKNASCYHTVEGGVWKYLLKLNIHIHYDSAILLLGVPKEKLLPNQTWINLAACRKASLLTPGCGKGKYSIYCRPPSKESR